MLHTHTSSPAHHAQLPSSSINYPSWDIQTHLLLLLLLCPGDVLMPATTPWCLQTPSRELQAQLNLRPVILRHPHPSLHATAWKPRQDEPPSPKEQLPDSPLSSPFPIFFLLLGLFCFFFLMDFVFPELPYHKHSHKQRETEQVLGQVGSILLMSTAAQTVCQ